MLNLFHFIHSSRTETRRRRRSRTSWIIYFHNEKASLRKLLLPLFCLPFILHTKPDDRKYKKKQQQAAKTTFTTTKATLFVIPCKASWQQYRRRRLRRRRVVKLFLSLRKLPKWKNEWKKEISHTHTHTHSSKQQQHQHRMDLEHEISKQY